MSRTAPKGQITQAMRVISPARRSLPLSITSILQRAQTAETEDLLQKVHELNVTTDYLQKILRNMSQGLIFINFSGFLITCNASAANFLGINPVEALFQHYSESISDGIFGFSLEEALKTHCVPNFPITIDVETSQGDKLQLEVDVYLSNKTQQHDETPLNRDDSLNFSEGLLILIRDVTEIARLKRRNERDSRMRLLGEMAAVVAHEIRNPLAGIKGFASLLVEDLSDRPALVEMAKSIVEGVDGLNRIVTNILNYARPLEPKYVSTDLPQLIETLIASLKTDPKMETISISSSYTPEKFAMEIDPHLIRSALLNLLLNAVQAIDERGSIKIHSFFDGNGCILTIEDSGVGMSEKQLERLFVPFFTTKANGSGLGLAEVHKIVQAHEGTIHADSSPGAGARFVLFLPNHRSQDCTDSIPSPKSNYPEGEL